MAIESGLELAATDVRPSSDVAVSGSAAGNSDERSFVIGIDVGGTFTDAVCSDGANVWRAKSPTNPARFSDGVLGGCRLLAAQLHLPFEAFIGRIARFGLGTTAVTNVLATKRGRTVGLITTAGIEDHLHAMRGHRKSEDGWLVLGWNPVQQDAVRGIAERIDRRGQVLHPINPQDVAVAAKSLVEDQGVNAFAVSFLWAFRNPAHEQQAVEVIRRLYPDYPVYSGADLNPVMREYERTTLAVLNAFTADALDGVEELGKELKAHGLKAPMLLLHSGGGAITVDEARATPIALASSGPAAGAVAAGEVTMAHGLRNGLCCDMGGTSIDVAVVVDGVPHRRQTAEIGGLMTSQSAIDVESIGAGGGSMAWIDDRGLLRVGPQSARATPGPVCYGRGGTVPTVTDAMVLLGYIDPASFMGGAMKLDIEAARNACARLGEPIGLSALETAYGIREIALAEMGKAMRARISSGGIDVRKFGVVAFGGSGSLFATPMAQELELPWVLTPAVASVLSAYGAATADIQRERTIAIDEILPDCAERANAAIAELKLRADADLAHQHVDPAKRELVCEVDLRFHRQRNSLTIVLENGVVEADELVRRFQSRYAEQYGLAGVTGESQVEISNVRVIGIGRTVRAVLPDTLRPRDTKGEASAKGHRTVYVGHGKQVEVPVFDAEQLRPGDVVVGPALLDKVDTTLWAPAGATVSIEPNGSLITRFEGAGR
ncbi:hydantoinase/oxoprolinase family protein [Novosphingobium sp.]|uniref:hydantoinase/oxoprolinase family protein n=1 Tax=Novosphingobium sp. TaxID=1874826 RepID=UPI0038BACD60